MRRLPVLILALLGACPVLGDAVDDAYLAGPFSFLSHDYFARFTSDPGALASEGEVALAPDWAIVVDVTADPVTTRMAEHLVEFLKERMGLDLPIRREADASAAKGKALVLQVDEDAAPLTDAFTISVTADSVVVRAGTPADLRDGVVNLVDRMGFRASPILAMGESTTSPRLETRVGAVPWMGSLRDVVFQGSNAVILTPEIGSRAYAAARLHELSSSSAIPELAALQQPALLERLAQSAREARRYGLKTYLPLRMWDFYPADAPIFANHPELRGAEALYFLDQPPKGYLLCTEAALMRQYLQESIRGLFDAIPLDGILIIIGGEEFQHCFMRPAGVTIGHTNCARCEPLGADTVVSNLCNALAAAARQANPEALVVAWPYSAGMFWSADDMQSGFIEKLMPGTALLTEIEKDGTVIKEGGVNKLIWDYSIDLIGPTDRAKRQIAACKARGIPVFLKSEPELAFEAPGLPYIPCLDRWYDRAEALAASGADGAWVFPWFQPCYGTTSAEVYKYAAWTPAPGKEAVLAALAQRIAGKEAAPLLRQAWASVSEAIAWSPEQPPYFSGPYYLGPAHPMFADPDAPLPDCFTSDGKLSMHVLKDARGDAVRGNAETFGRYYREMQEALKHAVDALDAARPLVPPRCMPTFRAEESPARWFYHTARSHANFYASARHRDFLRAFAELPMHSPEELAEARLHYEQWRAVLADEKANTIAAIPVVEQDPRLDFRNGAGKSLAPAVELMRAKLEMLDHELNEYLPALAQRCGIGT
jgi:hypothetical protein